LGRSGCKGIDSIARGVNDPIHGIGDLVSGMAGKILGKGIAKELAAGPLCAARKQLSPFKDGVGDRYSCFHTISITTLQFKWLDLGKPATNGFAHELS
jgi:hypothetical protein